MTASRSLVALCLSLLVATSAAAAQQATAFDADFTGATWRLDLFHSGTAGEEHFAVDSVRREGPWPGSRVQLEDTSGLGKYFLEVRDGATHRVLFSHGFASIYGEWETTGEAQKGVWRTIHESVRFPEPRRPVDVVLKKRQDDGSFGEIYSTPIDPAGRTVDRSPIPEVGEAWTVLEGGPVETSVDLLILGDGYTAGDSDVFEADVERLTAALFATEPFRSRKGSFNVRALMPPSHDAGVTDPRAGAWHNTALGLTYNAFDSERYVLTFANRRLREIAAQQPYDALILLANNRKYGGGGIYELWTTAAAHNAEDAYLVVHEFGHSFAGLGDEYYTSQVSYQGFTKPGVEPWEPNVTALLPGQNLKWSDLVQEGTPIPTPWHQDAYDEISVAYQEQRQKL
ncbi:MAG: peptidase M64, partial [Acidobacteria bacterium]|nr:peptidase M64 [Acidobacteriota bacterium]